MMRAVKRQPSLFDDVRMDLARALELTAADLNLYGPSSRHWVVTFSGGKDSTATLTALHWLVREGRVRPPETLTALYADTRLELPPLQASALEVLRHLEAQGVRVRVVTPPLDHRFFVYMLGRGVPVFVKQLGSQWARQAKARDPKGEDMGEWPAWPPEIHSREWPSKPREILGYDTLESRRQS